MTIPAFTAIHSALHAAWSLAVGQPGYKKSLWRDVANYIDRLEREQAHMTSKTLTFGDRARDTITGFMGIVIGRCYYISGCNQVLLAPPVKDDGEHRSSRWFDNDRVELVEAGAVTLVVTDPGSDAPAPTK